VAEEEEEEDYLYARLKSHLAATHLARVRMALS